MEYEQRRLANILPNTIWPFLLLLFDFRSILKWPFLEIGSSLVVIKDVVNISRYRNP